MHRFIRRTLAFAALTVTAVPLSAQVVFDAAPGSGGIFMGNRGGIGQIMQVGTATTVTRLGFRLGVLESFPGTQSFTAYIATFAAPTTRLWEQSFSRSLTGNPAAIPSLVLTDAFSFRLEAGTRYFIGFYATGGPAGYGWTGSGETPISQNGLTQAGVRQLDERGFIIDRPEFAWQQSIRIEGTQVVVPPPPPVGVIPEPSTYALMATGLAALATLQRRRRRIATTPA